MDVFSLSGRLLKEEICRHIEPNESFVNIFQDRIEYPVERHYWEIVGYSANNKAIR